MYLDKKQVVFLVKTISSVCVIVSMHTCSNFTFLRHLDLAIFAPPCGPEAGWISCLTTTKHDSAEEEGIIFQAVIFKVTVPRSEEDQF